MMNRTRRTLGSRGNALRQPKPPKRVLMVSRGVAAEAAKDDVLQTARRIQSRRHGPNCDARGAVGREGIDAGRDGRKRD